VVNPTLQFDDEEIKDHARFHSADDRELLANQWMGKPLSEKSRDSLGPRF
jgi:hypothetical protein